MVSPKEKLARLDGKELLSAIGGMLDDSKEHKRFMIFFHNEYYPALIPVRDKMVILPRAVNGLIERGALNEKDREIIEITQRLASEWFIST